jgi:hypothetical protein
VARLTAGRPPEGRGALHQDHHQEPPRAQQQHRAVGDLQRMDNEVPHHRAALHKSSFPKFNRDNPWIWIDKTDYFRIFNDPDHMWTNAASLHMEDNAAKWL